MIYLFIIILLHFNNRSGEFSIMGHAVVVTEGPDDLGNFHNI